MHGNEPRPLLRWVNIFSPSPLTPDIRYMIAYMDMRRHLLKHKLTPNFLFSWSLPTIQARAQQNKQGGKLKSQLNEQRAKTDTQVLKEESERERQYRNLDRSREVMRND